MTSDASYTKYPNRDNKYQSNDERQYSSTSYLETKKSRLSLSMIRTSNNLASSLLPAVKERKEKGLGHSVSFNSSAQSSLIEDTEEISKVEFSLYIKDHSLIDKEKLPLIMRDSILVNINLKLSEVVITFIKSFNIKLKEMNLKLFIPKEIEELENYKNKTYIVKPMKKTGKPDNDLPGFEMTAKIKNLGVRQFSLIPQYDYINKIKNSPSVTKKTNEINTIDNTKIKDNEGSKAKNDSDTNIPKKLDTNKIEEMQDNNTYTKKSCCDRCFIF